MPRSPSDYVAVSLCIKQIRAACLRTGGAGPCVCACVRVCPGVGGRTPPAHPGAQSHAIRSAAAHVPSSSPCPSYSFARAWVSSSGTCPWSVRRTPGITARSASSVGPPWLSGARSFECSACDTGDLYRLTVTMANMSLSFSPLPPASVVVDVPVGRFSWNGKARCGLARGAASRGSWRGRAR